MESEWEWAMGEEKDFPGGKGRGLARRLSSSLWRLRNWVFVAAALLLILDVLWIAFRFSSGP